MKAVLREAVSRHKKATITFALAVVTCTFTGGCSKELAIETAQEMFAAWNGQYEQEQQARSDQQVHSQQSPDEQPSPTVDPVQGGTVDVEVPRATSGSSHEASNEIVDGLPAWYQDITAFSGTPYIYVNNNKPFFTKDDLATESYEIYSELDSLGRCGPAMVCAGSDIMPTEERGDISSIKPTGWAQEKYSFVDGGWLYNRCHLIAHSIAGEDANKNNLITGTRYMNIEGMWPIEETVVWYLRENPGSHVLYRVTPIFEGDNLLASGVLMEGYSVEDRGEGVCFCAYCYNVQPYVSIDYATGESFPDN